MSELKQTGKNMYKFKNKNEKQFKYIIGEPPWIKK